MKRSSLLFAPAVALSLVGAGCNPVQQAQDRAAESAVEQATGGKVKVDANGNQMQIKGDNGAVTTVGENISLPDSFPKDVPVYPGAKITAVSVSTSGEKGAILNLRSTDDVSKVIQWYEDAMAKGGFKGTQTMDAGQTKFRTYENGNVAVSFVYIPEMAQGSQGTTVSISRSEK